MDKTSGEWVSRFELLEILSLFCNWANQVTGQKNISKHDLNANISCNPLQIRLEIVTMKYGLAVGVHTSSGIFILALLMWGWEITQSAGKASDQRQKATVPQRFSFFLLYINYILLNMVHSWLVTNDGRTVTCIKYTSAQLYNLALYL